MERRPGEVVGAGVVAGRARGRGRARTPLPNPAVGRAAAGAGQPQPGASGVSVSSPATGIGRGGRGRPVQHALKETPKDLFHAEPVFPLVKPEVGGKSEETASRGASARTPAQATGGQAQAPSASQAGRSGAGEREERQRTGTPASVPGNEREKAERALAPRGEPGAALRPAKRPMEGGKAGRPILLRANFVKLVLKADNVLVWQYDIRVTSKKRQAEVKNKAALREVVDLWVARYIRPMDDQLYVAYDGRNSVYTNKQFPAQNGRFDVVLEDDREFCLLTKAAEPGVINLSEAMEYFNAACDPPPAYPAKQIQAMDIIIRESALQDGYFSIGRHLFFDVLRTSGRGRPLNPYYELWNGAFQSVRPTWKCLMLQVDMVVRAFHKDQHMLELQEQFEQEWGNRWVVNMSKHIQGVKFKGHTYGYTAFGLGAAANKHRFEVDGRTMTVEEYYKIKNNIILRYPNLPCVQAKPKEKNCFIPMELCKVKSNQQLDNLSEFLNRLLLEKQTMGAPQRMKTIDDIIKKLKFSDNKVLKAFNIQIEAKMMDNIEGRVLDPLSIEYKNGVQHKVVDGKWNLRGAQLYNAVSIRTVLIYSLSFERKFLDKSKLLLKELSKVAKSMGLSLPSEAMDIKSLNNKDTRAIEEQLNEIKNSAYDLPLLAIFILPEQRRNDLYDTIKTMGDSTLGIYTQCFKENNAFDDRGPKHTTLANLCLKINGKLGGVNSVVANTLEFFVFKKRVMIMGADVNHPGANRFKPSISAVTASYDRFACRYKSRIGIQSGGTETIVDLERMTKELLDDYSRANKELYPEMILYFRDGVSEGQFDKMLSFELACLRRACDRVNPNYRPGITVVVVRKRHRTKFEPMDEREASGPGRNVPPGTVEDRATVETHRFEYYLTSHFACKGTSKGGLYTVLHDTNGFTMDAMEQLSLHLCHLYARCTQAVSYPAPTYYADLCAERGRRYVECYGNNKKKEIRIHEDINGMYFL